MSEETTKPLPIGDIINRMYDIRAERSTLKDRDKELIAEWRELEGDLLNALDTAGMDMGRTDTASARITENVLPNVQDWDAFGEYIMEHNALHLLQRRPSAAAIRELLDANQKLPDGVDVYTQRAISLRKI